MRMGDDLKGERGGRRKVVQSVIMYFVVFKRTPASSRIPQPRASNIALPAHAGKAILVERPFPG